ncbi:hypothetical protein [Fulvivirga lutea]|uniref:Uncharacterized protein n=1 Tax=Fulvivirga lutea TaxID=2810512 RepID=A0A974ZZD7_9BACT|nr:hypothetical protein [Fulvivirga lutea]QSE96069.1 hypothetical protein JR347_10620 [Fulvivirga lutea]
MKGYCSTGKNYYHNKDAAEEALIEHLGRNSYAKGTGPINVYLCEFCDGYHFTSKGEESELLHDPEVLRRIKKLRIQSEWDDNY